MLGNTEKIQAEKIREVVTVLQDELSHDKGDFSDCHCDSDSLNASSGYTCHRIVSFWVPRCAIDAKAEFSPITWCRT